MSSFLGTLKAVSWSFLGIRKNSDYQNDLQKLNPLHIIVVAVRYGDGDGGWVDRVG